jgi:hypothetical protein
MTRALYAAGWGYVALCGLVLAKPQVTQTACTTRRRRAVWRGGGRLVRGHEAVL